MTEKKRVICDSGALISLSINCMTPLVFELSKYADFIITPAVVEEIITTPEKRGNHLMGPMKFRAMLDSGILKLETPDKKEVYGIMDVANSVYRAKGKELHIIQQGEAEALALANDGDVLLMDERTLRYLIEQPKDLLSLLHHRLHRHITMDFARAKEFQKYCKGVEIIRSAELVAVCFEKGILAKYFSAEPRHMFEACLVSLKRSGCSLSSDDIREYTRMFK